MNPSRHPVMIESSSRAMQQLDPLFVFPVVAVKTDLYSERSQILTEPFSSMLTNWSDLFGGKCRSLICPVWESVCTRNERSCSSTR